MKRVLYLIMLLFLSTISYAQEYVVQKQGELWGVNEKLYAEYGRKVNQSIGIKSYNLAIDYLKKMLNINAKNVDRKKDYYSLCHCYVMVDDCDNILSNAEKFETLVKVPKSRQDSIQYATVLSNKGYALIEKGRYREALLALEKSNSCRASASNFDFISKCYEWLGNMEQAKRNRKIAIAIEANNCHVNIYDIETKGINNPYLGLLFWEYRNLLPKTDESYHNFLYLSFLAAKCNHPDAVSQFRYVVNTPEIIVKNRDLFKLP